MVFDRDNYISGFNLYGYKKFRNDLIFLFYALSEMYTNKKGL